MRDPRQRRTGGRTPYKQPLTEPLVVEKVHGNKCTLRKPDGTLVEDVHVEDMIVVPDPARDLEREPLHFPEDDQYGLLDSLEDRRSPGEMLEDGGNLWDAVADANPKQSSKLEKSVAGCTVAYTLDKRTFTIGKVVNVSRAEGLSLIHI